jgi:diketogulonate reductase-like aldo/keto reductase
MYGRAERLLGELLPTLAHAGRLVAASKVWTPFDRLGPGQLEHSLTLWKLPRFDVLLVHNLLNWRDHLKTLRRWKDEGRVRRIGVSTSHGRRHDEAMRVLRSEPLDVLQITYNFADTSAEPVMNLAAERGLAVVINRPFDGGDLFQRVGRAPLPAWAPEVGCRDWPQFFLKWIVSHPAVTCAIPATRDPAHLDQNMAAAQGPRPDAAARLRMFTHLRRL